MNEHVRIWRYRVDPDRRQEFVHHYSSEGSWTQLFNRAPGYLGTRLWQDEGNDDVYFTQDRWCSKADFDAFKQEFGSVYEQMDEQLDGLTTEETFIGAMRRIK